MEKNELFSVCTRNMARGDCHCNTMMCKYLYALFISSSGLQTFPHNAKMHYNYGNWLRDVGNFPMAVHHYKEAARCVKYNDFIIDCGVKGHVENYNVYARLYD